MDADAETRTRVGRNIAVIREAQGLSQQALGELLGQDQAYVSKVERGKMNLTLKTLGRIASVLNQDVGIFFQREITIAVPLKKAAARR